MQKRQFQCFHVFKRHLTIDSFYSQLLVNVSENMQAFFDNLIPNTEYTITVYSKVGSLEGNKSSILATTGNIAY